ncbi:MAG: ribonuclease PH [Chloroflexota bacterium]|nr:ribonuclease PH [Chloroflexota bacterium]
MNRSSVRPDGRRLDELRPTAFTLDYIEYPEGSVLIEMGSTRVLCNASVEEEVPAWMAGRGSGWLTASYALLPRSTHTRTPRETDGLGGRTQEIRRLIGRSLRAAVDLELLGERLVIVDCDVLQADGGTRTASISGGYVAVALAVGRLATEGRVAPETLKSPVAAVSVGMIDRDVRLDLCYEEDRDAQVDLNVAMTGGGRLIEVQGTAEGEPFPRRALNEMLDLAERGGAEIMRQQQEALRSHGAISGDAGAAR